MKKVTDLRPISMSDINKTKFNCAYFVTPRKRVEFFNWNESEYDTHKFSLAGYDKWHKKWSWGYWAEVKLMVNVTNYCYDNECHFITVLEKGAFSYLVVKYQLGSNSSLKHKLSTMAFSTIKDLKEYLRTTKDKL